MKTYPPHFGGEFADATGDETGDEDFHDVVCIVVDSDTDVLSLERDLPGGPQQLLGPVFAIGSAFGLKDRY